MSGRIIVATGNAGKVREMQEILEGSGYSLVSMREAGVEADMEENGNTYEENAMIKARAIAPLVSDIVLADDSGMEVDYLGGEPGIYSARYLGEETSFGDKMEDILRRLEGVPERERGGRFVCAIAVILPDGTELSVQATMEGRIAHERSGAGGFGYDPIFYVPEYGKTAAELTEAEKNRISHRGKALQLMKEELRKYENLDCK